MYRADTIVACATPPGRGGVAVVRCSGPESRAIAADTFRAAGGGDAGTADMLLKNGTQLDDFRLYNTVLSADQIRAIMSGSQ